MAASVNRVMAIVCHLFTGVARQRRRSPSRRRCADDDSGWRRKGALHRA